jgi:branched-chain amino acid transport system permease protein
MMQGVLLYALAAAVLGGLDSPLGAVVGGLVLGVAVNLIGTYSDRVIHVDLGGQMRLVAGLAIILAVLLLRPTGLFGRAAARRV